MFNSCPEKGITNMRINGKCPSSISRDEIRDDSSGKKVSKIKIKKNSIGS